MGKPSKGGEIRMNQSKRFTVTAADGIELEAAFHASTAAQEKGVILQVHGITVDMGEGGLFVRLAEELSEAGFSALRFSFRGHGGSSGDARGMTIAGEMLDLLAAFELAEHLTKMPVAVVAASFGAIATCLLLPQIEARLRALVLWNPVLDLKRTFIHPETEWARTNFSEAAVEALGANGVLVIDDEFELGWVAYKEMELYDPYCSLLESQVSTLIIHGDADTYVPYSVSVNAARRRDECQMLTIKGSDHGFDTREREEQAIEETVKWLDALFGKAKTVPS